MSVDVEDYFQVCAFDRVVSRDDVGELRQPRRGEHASAAGSVRRDRRQGARSSCSAGSPTDHPELVREIAARGHEVASHGYNHQLVYMQTPRQFRDDVRAAKAALEDASGQAGRRLPRAEFFDRLEQSLWALDVLIEEGYRYDTSIFPIHHDRYGIPDAPRHIHTMYARRRRR